MAKKGKQHSSEDMLLRVIRVAEILAKGAESEPQPQASKNTKNKN